MNLSFSGCGFLGIYHLGVAKTFASDGKHFINNVERFGGASAGALIASLFAVHGADVDVVERCRIFCMGLAEEMKSKTFGVFTPGVDLLKPVERFMEELFPGDAHVRASSRLFVSVTNAETKENEIISNFESREILIQYLLASSCIPMITTSASIMIGNKKYFDGGLTNNLPTFHEGETIRVSPFEGMHEISPSISALSRTSADVATDELKEESRGTHITVVNQNFKVCLENLMRGLHIFSPPSIEVLTRYYRQGSKDAKRFLIDRGYCDALPSDEAAEENSSKSNAAGKNNDHVDSAVSSYIDLESPNDSESSPTIENVNNSCVGLGGLVGRVFGAFEKDGSSSVDQLCALGTSVDR